MKRKWFVGLVLAIVALSPILVALAVLVVIAIAVYDVGRGVIALATIHWRHCCLLYQLSKIGAPPFVLFSDDETGFWGQDDHSKCSLLRCEAKWEEVYHGLSQACEKAHVPKWRVRWVTQDFGVVIPFLFGPCQRKLS